MQRVAKQPGIPAGELLPRYYSVLRARFGPQQWWPARTRLEVILGAILTQNTTWHNATLALCNLRKSGLLSWQALRHACLSGLEACVRPSGFYRQKARTIRDFVDWLSREHAGSLDRLFSLSTDELRRRLLDLRGLGPETADAIILYATQRPLFVADAYTRRVLARHGFVSDAADYHQTQEFLHAHLPPDTSLFNEFHALLVAVGKKHCKPQSPRCAGCPLEEFLPQGGAAQRLAQAPAGTCSWQELQPA
ncbi:MAG: endonuclease III domain-containing protein [Terriglobia bacterium]|jgi:endonuclease-3 related protein